jgi:hypothetical protein
MQEPKLHMAHAPCDLSDPAGHRRFRWPHAKRSSVHGRRVGSDRPERRRCTRSLREGWEMDAIVGEVAAVAGKGPGGR